MDPKTELKRLARQWRNKAKRLEKWYAYGPDKIFETEVTQRTHDMYLEHARQIERVIRQIE